MIDKILHLFGLMTIKQAKHINQETSALLNRWIAEKAQNDFGVPPNKDGDKLNREWADGCFDLMINHQNPTGDLIGAWEL